jgi:hypothetical protein
MKLVCNGILMMALAIVWGCGGEFPPEPQSTSMAPPPPAPAPPGDGSGGKAKEAEAADPAATEPIAADAAASPATTMPADDSAAPAAGAPGSTDEVAQVGVGAKGKNYGGPGFVTTPIEAYFRTGERIAFEIQIPNAMKLYKADHNNKGPKTHEEFMDIIIKENGVQLPELSEGETFIYDPATEQLLVRHPEK